MEEISLVAGVPCLTHKPDIIRSGHGDSADVTLQNDGRIGKHTPTRSIRVFYQRITEGPLNVVAGSPDIVGREGFHGIQGAGARVIGRSAAGQQRGYD